MELRASLVFFISLWTITTAAASTMTTSNPSTSTTTSTTSISSASVSQVSTSAATTTTSVSSAFLSTASASTTSSYAGLSDLPTLAGLSAPTLIVPDLSGAPFMQTSSLPEGTVFIVVGAMLGVLGAAVLAWRTTVAYSIRRSVHRAAVAAQYGSKSDVKGGTGRIMSSYQPSVFAPTAGHYSSLARPQSLPLDKLTSQSTSYTGPGFGAGSVQGSRGEHGASTGRSKKGTLRTPVTSTLFFSPTASVAGPPQSNLFSGFGGGAPPQTSPTRGAGERGSVLAGSGRRGGRVRGAGMQRQERAPSAYLEDMFESGASMRNAF